MKVYILTDCPFHENETIFGVYSTEEKAREAMTQIYDGPPYYYRATRIVAFDIDALPSADCVQVIEEGEET